MNISSNQLLFRYGVPLATVVVLLEFGTSAFGQEINPGASGSGQDPLPDNSAPAQALLVETPEHFLLESPLPDQVDDLIQNINLLQKNAFDADDLFLRLDQVLHSRIRRINQRMRDARSPLEDVFATNELPPDIVTIADLHANIEALYEARLRLLEHLTPNLYLEVTATDIIGVEQFRLELQFIFEQIKFRSLNLPSASADLWRRMQIAPLPVIWRIIQFFFVVAIFRWWRAWFPETLKRVSTSLSEFRPRSPAIMRRIRLIWYFGQLRRPLEWMLLFYILFSMADMPGLNLLIEIISVIVQWILLGWLSVAFLNAVSARGDAGLTGVDAKVRLKSLRLVATWLVLLGLGLSLAENLAGEAALHAWVWRIFQIMTLPVLLILLAWWRKPIFSRLETENDNTEKIQHLLQKKTGIQSYRNAVRGGTWLIANSLRRRVLRMILHVGADQAISLGGKKGDSSTDAVDAEVSGISQDVRNILLRGVEEFDRYGRAERRILQQHIDNNQGGIVAIVGERGIGKRSFIESMRKPLGDQLIVLNCEVANFSEIESGLAAELGIGDRSSGDIASELAKHSRRVIAINSMHRIVRPVIGGQVELGKLSSLIEEVGSNVLWVFTVDCFAWQFIRRARADQSSINEVIKLPAWSEDQLSALIDQRNDDAGIDANFDGVKVPAEHAVTDPDTPKARVKAGVYRMIWTLARGNPTMALHLWADSLYTRSDGEIIVRTPSPPTAVDLDVAQQNILLVLRAIAAAELITADDIADNLRLPSGAVSSAMHYCLSRGWIEESRGRFRLSLPWFRTITRVLIRQNLLAH